MFGLSDMLALQRYYELQDLHGMSRDAAAVETHKFVSSYRLPTTIGGSRVLQQVLADPAFSLFGPYHGGMWMTYGHLFKTLLGSAATQQQRTRAFGQLLVGAAITGIVGPLLDEAYKKATGNDGASISPRGFSTIPRKMYDVATGNNVSGALANIFTPALPLDAATEIMHNTDAFTGKPIVQPMDMSRPKNILKGAVQGGEFLARKLVPPIGTAESAARQGLTPGQAIGRVAEEQFGGHTPSSPENKYKAHQPVYNQRDEKKRGKNPPGVIEGLLGR